MMQTMVLRISFLVLVVFAAALYLSSIVPQTSDAAIFVDACAKADDKEACYEERVSVLYPEHSIKDVFSLVREIRRIDKEYQFCHVLAHKLGERVVAEDPENWLDAIPLNPSDGLCSNGFIHGVIGGKFRAEVLDDATLKTLETDFNRACEPRANWSPSPLDQAICYHGLGHLYMYITDADIRKALMLCEKTAGKKSTGDFRVVCREGVFMQIYQPLEPDDFLLIERMETKPSTTTVRAFCAQFPEDEYEGACLRESWPFFGESIVSGRGVEAFCAGQPNTEEETACYHSATAIIGRMSLGRTEQGVAACAQLPKPRQSLCFTTVARTILEENREEIRGAAALCERAPADIREGCFAGLVRDARFIFGSDAGRLHAFCRAVPASLQETCLQGEVRR